MSLGTEWRPNGKAGKQGRCEVYLEVGEEEGRSCGIFLTPALARRASKHLAAIAKKAEDQTRLGH